LAGLNDIRYHQCQSTQDMLLAKPISKMFDMLDAIQDRQDNCLRPYHGLHHLNGFCCVVGLNTEEDQIDRAHFCWVVRGFGRIDFEISTRALYPQSSLMDGLEMLPPSNKCNIMTFEGEPSSNETSQPSCSHDSNLHDLLLVTCVRKSLTIDFPT